LLHAGWVGGEPLLRIPLLAECVRLFPMNMIVTNGTIALPVLPKSVFNVSVDGTRAIYEAIRGARVYDTVKDHANRNDVRVNIACVINRMNRECIEALVEEWRKTKIRGISFSFYTPAWKEDNGLNLSGAERDAVIDRLLVLKKDHGDFIINSRSVLVLMKSASSSAITTRCLAQKVFLSVDATGTPKLPCVLGAQADCARCGCVVPFEIESVINRRHFDSLRTVKKFYAG
jgi:MoaA/NifB/PqqE/SkfB family radical SAM enzyme